MSARSWVYFIISIEIAVRCLHDEQTPSSAILSVSPRSSNRIVYENNNKEDIIIEADRERLTQVISNLLNNAIKFTKDIKGGEDRVIRIDIKKMKNEQKEYVVASIKDSGTGIDPEIIPRLFERFASKSFSGTGLGLFISKSIIEAHGGRIWAENNKDGKGATFSFSLPIVNIP
jgi:two-component system, OmpR family, sensor histidine kinase VicK